MTMCYRDALLSASDEARLFIGRIEAIEELEGYQSKIDRAVEQAVDACAASFFESVRQAMVKVADVPAAEYRLLSEVSDNYCTALPETFRGRAAMVSDIGERGRCLLAAVKDSLERQLGREQSAREVLSALMLMVQACERVLLEQRYGE